MRVSTTVPDYEICFHSADWSVGLRRDDWWWVLDTIDDRNQERRSAARFSSFALVEKYLLWDWGATANPALASGKLGPDLARRGFAPGVTVTKVEGGHQICLNDDCAVLNHVRATIFSHLMAYSFEDIAAMISQG